MLGIKDSKRILSLPNQNQHVQDELVKFLVKNALDVRCKYKMQVLLIKMYIMIELQPFWEHNWPVINQN